MFTFSSWKLYNLRKQIQTKKLKSIVQTNLFDELNYVVFSIFTIQEGDKACITVFSLLIRENYKYRSSTKLFSPVRYLFYVQCFCKRGGNINQDIQLTENERTNSFRSMAMFTTRYLEFGTSEFRLLLGAQGYDGWPNLPIWLSFFRVRV